MHLPVLAEAALDWLAIREDGIYIDCTAGAGGHSALIAERLRGGRLIALDRDPAAVAETRDRLASYACVTVVQGNYGELSRALCEVGADEVNGVLVDAGLSSMQLDDPQRGFSFQTEGPLDMRMDPTTGQSAWDYLHGVNEKELKKVLKSYGDVGPAGRISRAIVRRRDANRLETTADLKEAVTEALPFVTGTPNELRTVFQSIRMIVNDELAALERGLTQAIDHLSAGGRLVCISFHSGEDRVVKNVFRTESKRNRLLHPDGRVKSETPARLRTLTAKPVTPTAEEIETNPRAGSAKLRAAQRI